MQPVHKVQAFVREWKAEWERAIIPIPAVGIDRAAEIGFVEEIPGDDAGTPREVQHDRAHVERDGEIGACTVEAILWVFREEYGHDVDATSVGCVDEGIEMGQRLVHAVVWIRCLRAAEDIVIQEYAYGVDSQRAQTVHVGVDSGGIPGAMGVSAKLERRAVHKVGIARMDVVDATHFKWCAIGAQLRTIGGDQRDGAGAIR